MKIAIIGGGHMGATFARCLIAAKVCAGIELLIIEIDAARRRDLEDELHCRTEALLESPIADYEAVILAVKPQDMQSVCAECCRFIAPEHLIISVMAGVTLSDLSRAFPKHNHIVRSMPNIAAQVMTPMTVYTADSRTSPDSLAKAKEILQAAGAVLYVEKEGLIDAATAISGSGPAYFFYFIEHMLAVAEELGFTQEEANLLVSQTITGAVNVWRRHKIPPNELRAMVTSKGGTTAAALSVFESEHLGETFKTAIRRAFDRSKELSAALQQKN